MFSERFPEVVVSIRIRQKQINFLFDLNLGETGQVILRKLIEKIKIQCLIEQETQIYYYDHTKNEYISIDKVEEIPIINIICQNKIMIRFSPKISDELLANPPILNQNKNKRSGERGIRQAFGLVARWRRLYMWGYENQQGENKKLNLDQAAQIIGIPRKSLQDYFLLLRVGQQLSFDYRKHKNDKMGVLRKYIRQKPKIQKQKSKSSLTQQMKQSLRLKQQKFFNTLGRQLQSQFFKKKQPQQQIYDVLAMEIESSIQSKSNSDQNLLMEELEE